MNKTLPFLILSLLLSVLPAVADSSPSAGQLRGHYLEARTSDIYTGPCFANSEMNLAGREAILAWRVTEGSWSGVDLAGLGVVAVVRANATLGDPHAPPLDSRSVLLVDERADERQRQALVELARDFAGELVADVVAIENEPIDLRLEGHGGAILEAGQLASLRVRGLHDGDHLCGNEEVFYPPLSPVEHAHPAVTLEHRWQGPGLDATWSSPDKRSAFVGTFVR